MAKQGGETPTDIDDDQLASRVEELVRRGMDRYGQGDLVGALSEWEHAVSLEPDHAQAQEYISYVRDNFEALEREFAKAREVASEVEDQGVPFVAGATLDADDDYDAFEVEDPDSKLSKWIDDVDDGWDADDFAAPPLPPAPEALAIPTVAPSPPVDRGEEADFSDLNMALDEETQPPSGKSAEMIAVELEADEPPLPPEAQETVQYPSGQYPMGEWLDLTGSGDYPAAAQPPRARDADDELTVPGGEEPPPLSSQASLSRDALDAMGAPKDDAQEPPGRQVPADFDLGEVGRLDRGMRDDRIDGPDAGVQVTFHDVGTGEKTMPARPSSQRLDRPLELDLGEGDELLDEPGRGDTDADEEQTVERSGSAGLWPRAFDDLAFEGDEERTGDRGRIDIRPPTEDPLLRGESVIVEDSLYDGGDLDATREVPAVAADLLEGATRMPPALGMEAVKMEVVAAQMDVEIDEGAPEDEPEDARTRRRVTALIDRATAAMRRGHASTAVVAVDLALDEKPESAIAQKIVHQHRDLLFEVFEAYVGELDGIPTVALPAHEIALQELDSRAAFLLSRIDGTLTFDEILDVAGMARLEAYRHLCRLLLRGILEVR